MISNPLVNLHQINSENDINEYNSLYILCYHKNDQINESIYHYMIDKDLFDEISKDLVLIKGNKKLLKNHTHLTKVNIISKHILDRYNIHKYNLEDKNLVLLILNISIDSIRIYLSQFTTTHTFIDMYKSVTLNKYFNVDPSNQYLITVLERNIMNLNESNYWTYNFNCNANLTSCFEKRKLNFYSFKNIFDDYLKEIYKTKNYIDPSKLITTRDYKFKINLNNVFSKDEIRNLLIGLPKKARFLLFCNLLISKSYCHLILNNLELLKLMKSYIEEYPQLFRYLIGYAWVRFYFEESIKKTFTTKNDQFIFNIDTASELPVYPFSLKYAKYNPYMPILADDDILNAEYNIGGVNTNINDNHGIANLLEFRENLNIFCTGDPKINLFNNIEWQRDKIALGGSIMCACIQKNNPLIALFNNYPEKEKLKRYYNEYYAKSDIDVMFLTSDDIDFMGKVKTFYNQIIINVCDINTYAQPSHIHLECQKHAYLFVTEEEINNIVSQNANLTKQEIINDFENDDIKLLFKDIFDSRISKYKKIFLNKISEDYRIMYPEYFDFDNLIFKVRIAKPNLESDSENLNISISIKYKITSPHLDYPFELFRVNYNDFFATVQTFHLPCVRSYYDGENVYLTPSCISAHLTFMNLDYRYFAGTSNPVEIINKYRMRGFGTWLNNDEKKMFMEYSQKNSFWNRFYNINFKIKETLISNSGTLDLNHKLFHPRLFNEEEYYECIPVDIEKGYNTELCNVKMKINSLEDFITLIDKKFDNRSVLTINNIIKNYVTINEEGSIKPVEKWIIDAFWNIVNQSDTNKKAHLKKSSNIHYKT